MNDFYGEMADMARELMGEFRQGTVSFNITEVDGDVVRPPELESWEIWEPPVITRTYRLNATVRSVEDKFLERTTIQATDDQITFPPLAKHIATDGEPVDGETITYEPEKGSIIYIDGVAKSIVERERKPGAGTVIVWTIWARA